MYHKILHEPLRFPKGERLQLSEPSKDLLRGMLERKVSDRLGCGAGAAADIKRSAFFVSLDFNKVRGGAAGTSPDQPVAFSLFTLFSRRALSHAALSLFHARCSLANTRRSSAPPRQAR